MHSRADIATFVGGEHLYFYDAISPIVLAETIDMEKRLSCVPLGTEVLAVRRSSG